MPTRSQPLAALAALVLTACGPPDGQLAQLMRELLDAQNAVRASAQPAPSPALAPFTWSESAASVAQAWANGCTYAHNSGRGALGENIAANAPAGSLDPADIVNQWASESQDYDYATNACNGVCGHYTQLVWRNTASVGCARATCPASSSPFSNNQSWDFWVCDYDPPGNFTGQSPY